ncbi:MAG: phosphoribosylformylglycinamidine synthase subunit PurS [Deltaproteobacteria bacterium]|nr:phosphoribosylformylglycinamidine synthase subunit PurS [Deltaproteobacteria bacterium]
MTRQATNFQAKVKVRLKPGVLDPQGEAILRSLNSLGYKSFQSIRVGKLIELVLSGENQAEVESLVAKIADELLANPNMEKFNVAVEPLK